MRVERKGATGKWEMPGGGSNSGSWHGWRGRLAPAMWIVETKDSGTWSSGDRRARRAKSCWAGLEARGILRGFHYKVKVGNWYSHSKSMDDVFRGMPDRPRELAGGRECGREDFGSLIGVDRME